MIETDPFWIEFHKLAADMKKLSDARITAMCIEGLQGSKDQQVIVSPTETHDG